MTARRWFTDDAEEWRWFAPRPSTSLLVYMNANYGGGDVVAVFDIPDRWKWSDAKPARDTEVRS